MKQIVYKSSARKALRRIPKNTAKLILGKIEQYAEDPASLANNVKKLQGREGIRLRVGDWRVIKKWFGNFEKPNHLYNARWNCAGSYKIWFKGRCLQ